MNLGADWDEIILKRKETSETDTSERRLQTDETNCISIEGCDQCAFIAFSHAAGTVILVLVACSNFLVQEPKPLAQIQGNPPTDFQLRTSPPLIPLQSIHRQRNAIVFEDVGHGRLPPILCRQDQMATLVRGQGSHAQNPYK